MLYEASDIKELDYEDFVNDVSISTQIQYTFGDILEAEFGDKYESMCCMSWMEAVSKHAKYVIFLDDFLNGEGDDKQIINTYVEKIRKITPEYKAPEIINVDINTGTGKGSGACYVATAVYGSYDCPEVWTLRRFRDYSLAKTWYGRAFIRVYYAISPTLVKWFGQAEWFKSIFRVPLEKLVSKLNEKGYENTHYID
jgi:hypothetical protein